MKRISLYLITLFLCCGFAYSQTQNFILKNPDSNSDSHTYVGRDYVRLLPGYSFSPSQGKTMTAKISSTLNPTDLSTFLNAANNSNPDVVTAIDKTKAVGMIPITSSINSTGAKCYNVPVEVLPGYNGLQPNLTIGYNSQSGNGIMGVGWKINGTSTIERVNKNMYYDGKNDIPDLSDKDVFTLDGVRLIETGRTGSVVNYETAVGNIKVVGNIVNFSTFNYNWIATFKVYYPNGNVGTFGYATSYNQYSFPITELKDINGNTISYSYYYDGTTTPSDKRNIFYSINEINYGTTKIKFLYQDRNDVVLNYDANCPDGWSLSKRISKIQVLGNGDSIRSYHFTYTNLDARYTDGSVNTDVSRLTQIDCSVNGNLLNPIKFYYGDGTTPSISTSSFTFDGANFDLSKNYIFRGKFDSKSGSDGLLVYSKKDYYQNNIFSYNSCPNDPQYECWEQANSYAAMYPVDETIKIYRNIDTNISPASLSSGSGFEGALLADLDGNGQNNVVKINARNDSGNEIITLQEYLLNSDNTLSLNSSVDVNVENNKHSIDPTSITPFRYFTGNFTGRGKTEILAFSNDNSIQATNFIIEKNSNFLNVYYISQYLNILINPDELVYPIDVDGDGQTELACVRSDKTYLYKFKEGSGFENISTWTLNTADLGQRQVMFADLNGDGFIDIVRSPKAQLQQTWQEPLNNRARPSWFNNTSVYGPCILCPSCGYLLTGVYRDYSSNGHGQVVCLQHVGKLKYSSPINITDFYPGTPPQNGQWEMYPKVSGNKATYLCPGCEKTYSMDVYDWDRDHCYLCGGYVNSIIGCWKHGWHEDISWSPPLVTKSKTTSYNDWIYQYTNGRSIVKAETVNGITRTNDHKYSIHEINGDDTPDLIVQQANGKMTIYPFDISSHKFQKSYLSTQEFAQSYELIDYDLNSGNSYSAMIAVGSNQVVKLTLPQNHVHSNMLSLMVNSVGVADKTDYCQLSQGVNYTLGQSATYPYMDFNGSMWVTNQCQVMSNKQIVSNTAYSYNSAIMHLQGLGFCGFSEVHTSDLMTNHQRTTQYDPYRLSAITHQNSETEESNFNYSFTVAPNKKTTLLLTDKTVTDKLKSNTITESYSLYDSFGNPGKIITDYGSGIKLTTNLTYQNIISGSNYILLGMPLSRETISERDGKSFTQRQTFEYYPYYNFLHYKRAYTGNNLLSETEYIYFNNYGTIQQINVHKVPSNDYLTSSYTYDTDNYMLKTKTDAFGLVTTYTNNLNKRLLMDVADYKGNHVTYGYDDWLRKTSETSTIDHDVVQTTNSVQWNADTDINRLIKQVTTTTGQPAVTSYMDDFGRESRKVIQGFDGSDVIADKAYDNYGRLSSDTSPYKPGITPITATYSYDVYDRLTGLSKSNGSVTSYTYSGNSVTQNADGIVSTSTTDATGKTVSMTDNGGTVNYTYRPDGQPDNVNTAGVITSFEYNDPYKRQTKLIDPSAGSVETIYNDAAHMVTQVWNNDKQISTIYNQYGQPVSRTTPDFTTSYSYEEGRPKTISSSNGTSAYLTYDTFGRLWKSAETINGKTYQEEYAYSNGKIDHVAFDANTGTNTLSYKLYYKYNTAGYLYRLADDANNTLAETISVNELGQQTAINWGNGLSTSTAYTPEGLMTGIKTGRFQDMTFSFNRVNGTLTSRKDNIRSLAEGFGYDNLYRLTTYGANTVNYAPNGNIQSKTDAGTYNYTDSSKPYTMQKLTNGTQDEVPELNFTYTVQSRPLCIADANGLTATFSYNDNYDRTTMQVAKSGATLQAKTYFAQGKYEIVNEAGSEKQRLYLDGSPYDASIVLEKTGSDTPRLYFLHRDYLGSVTHISDNSGNLAAEYSYDAWGRLRDANSWQPYAYGAIPEPMFGRGYTGHEHLTRFGLINMNARLYDPVLGRFYAPDPQVADPETTNGYNRYAYASNNPLMYVDPDGERDGYPGGYGGGSYNPFNGSYYQSNLPLTLTQTPFSYGGGGFNYGSGGGANFGGGVNYSGGYAGSSSNWAGSIVSSLFNFFSSLGGSSNSRPTLLSEPTPIAGSQNVAHRIKPLPKPVGTGASTVYAGGGKSMRMDNTRVATKAYQGELNLTTDQKLSLAIDALHVPVQAEYNAWYYRMPFVGEFMRAGGAHAQGNYLSMVNNLCLGAIWLFTDGVGGEVSSIARGAEASTGIGLADDVAKTFQFGKYTEMTLDNPIILSRYYDNATAFAKGRFMTNSTSSFTVIDRMRLALRPSWNGMTKVAHWEIPAGTTIYKGKAAMQFPWIGGKTQYFIPELENIKRIIR